MPCAYALPCLAGAAVSRARVFEARFVRRGAQRRCWRARPAAKAQLPAIRYSLALAAFARCSAPRYAFRRVCSSHYRYDIEITPRQVCLPRAATASCYIDATCCFSLAAAISAYGNNTAAAAFAVFAIVHLPPPLAPSRACVMISLAAAACPSRLRGYRPAASCHMLAMTISTCPVLMPPRSPRATLSLRALAGCCHAAFRCWPLQLPQLRATLLEHAGVTRWPVEGSTPTRATPALMLLPPEKNMCKINPGPSMCSGVECVQGACPSRSMIILACRCLPPTTLSSSHAASITSPPARHYACHMFTALFTYRICPEYTAAVHARGYTLIFFPRHAAEAPLSRDTCCYGALFRRCCRSPALHHHAAQCRCV